MRRAGFGVELAWFLFAAAAIVFAQDKDAAHHYGKAGLWEVTTTTTWQKAPPRLGSPGAPPRGGSHSVSVCLTQAMVDAGALLPQSRGQCRVQNKVAKPGSVTADYVCAGKMNGTGKLETSVPDLEHVNGTIHFAGTLDVGARPQLVEWTTTSSAVFKSAECPNNNSAPAPANPPK